MNEKKLQLFAVDVRQAILDCVHSFGNGHVGGALSMADVAAVLYADAMKVDPQNPLWGERDILACSKGHAGPAVYAALYVAGFFPKEMLLSLNQNGTKLPSHCDRQRTPGVDVTAGSLGQGLSVAVGAAFGLKLQGSSRRVYAINGDGELQEGQIWEAIQFAAQKKLDNLITFVDINRKQIDGFVADINASLDLSEKYEAFGWYALRCNGNDVAELSKTIREAKELKGRPVAILMDTVKGKGIPFIENMDYNHAIPINDEQYAEATRILEQERERIEKEA